MIDKNQGRLAEQSLLRLVASLRAVASQTAPTEHWVISAAIEAESYTDRILEALVEASSIRSVRFGSALISSVKDHLYRSWDDRLDWLMKGFNIATNNVREVSDVRTLADLRNALVHGGGRMTLRQRNRVESQVGLEARFMSLLNVCTEGGLLYLGSETAIKSIEIARGYIVYVDRTARLEFPSMRF